MALGRTLQDHLFHPELRQRSDSGARQFRWRMAFLIGTAVVAAGFTSYSLIVDPPDTAPAPTSYLP